MSDPATPGLRVLAVDDEPPALGELTYLLEQSEAVAAVTPTGSAADALAALQSTDFDAVFLDIRMPGIDGLALAGILTRFAAPPPVVFVTAYDNHAVDAFEVAAVDYLLKPIRAERLALALTRVRAALESRRGATELEREGSGGPAAARDGSAAGSEAPAADAAPTPPAPPHDETIVVELGGVTRYLRRSEVVYVEAQRDYVRLCTRTGGHLVRIPLASLEERWEPAGFVRVHRRFLVNSAFVEALRSAAGRVSVDLGAGQSVPVSRRFTPEVRAALVQRHRLDRDPTVPTGSTGPSGSAVPTVPSGSTGSTGSAVPTVPSGSTGPTGPTGPSGSADASGSPGQGRSTGPSESTEPTSRVPEDGRP